VTRRRVVAGNWKMHGSTAWIDAWVRAWLSAVDSRAQLALLPPAPYLGHVVARVAGRGVWVGAQNVHAEQDGAFTGEVSAEMVRDLGGVLTLVGHSERRRLFGEDDAVVAAKFRAAQRAGLMPVLCVGETLADRRAGRAMATVTRQVDAVLNLAGAAAFAHAMVAYEPVWAIGTGVTATPADAQEMHAAIRARVAARDSGVAAGLSILYGGSVKAGNAAALFAEADVDGGLVGGAALDAGEFARICNAP
jgi:triosephosphate isomerase